MFSRDGSRVHSFARLRWCGLFGMAGVFAFQATPLAWAEPLPDLPASIAEFPSVVHFKNNWRGAREKKFECRPLTIISRTTNLPALTLTSAGLGEVTFNGKADPICSSLANWVPAIRVVITQPTRELKLTARFPARELVDPSNTLQGKLILWTEGFKPLESSMRVERLPGSPAFRSALWFLGVGIPALIGFLIGWMTTRLKTRWDDHVAFAKYRYSHYNEIKDFFKQYHSVYEKKADLDYCRDTFSTLSERGILENVPLNLQRRLLRYTRAAKRAPFDRTLRKAFPEWAIGIK